MQWIILKQNKNFIQKFKTRADQRNLGMSMKVERSSLDQVKKRFETIKKKKEDKKRQYDFDERMKEMKEEVNFCCYIKYIRYSNLHFSRNI